MKGNHQHQFNTLLTHETQYKTINDANKIQTNTSKWHDSDTQNEIHSVHCTDFNFNALRKAKDNNKNCVVPYTLSHTHSQPHLQE